MKHLTIIGLPDNINREDLSGLSAFLEQLPVNNIDTINWPDYPYKPQVSFRMAYDKDAFFLRFDVKEKYVRALATENNGCVWLDSCVEFFLSPDKNDVYYNLEFNCIGTKLLGYKSPGEHALHAPDETISKIRCKSSLGDKPFEEKTGDFSWNLVAVIPFEVYWKHTVGQIKGLSMHANFYKCGDELTEPHFLSWNEIKTDAPSFHQPGFFGRIMFD